MSVIFKSNVRATAIIQNISGFQGPADFYAHADISNHQYVKNGVNVDVQDIINAPTQGAFTVLVNEFGDVSISKSAVPRRSYLVEHHTFGLLASTSNSNSYYLATNSIVLPETNVRPYAIYATKGSAKISDLDLSKITYSKGTGTLKDPFIFYYKNDVNLRVNKSFDAENIVCVPLANNRVPYAPYGAPGSEFDAPKTLDPSVFASNNFSIVIRTIEPLRGIDSAMNGIGNLIKFIQDSSNAITVAKSRGSDLRTNILKNGASAAAWQAAETNRYLDTLVFTVKDGVMRCALNGTIMPLIANQMPSNFSVSKIELMSPDTQWGTEYPQSALLNLVTYKRALTLEEMQSCKFN